MAGYPKTPLAQKLGIKPGMNVGSVAAPPGSNLPARRFSFLDLSIHVRELGIQATDYSISIHSIVPWIFPVLS
jgi:hypothetical protein